MEGGRQKCTSQRGRIKNSTWMQCEQVCISVGCVPPAYCPYLPACTAPKGGECTCHRVRGCTCQWRVPAPVLPPVNRMTERCKKNCPKLRLRVVNMLIFCCTTCTAPAKFPSKRRFDSLVKITPGIVIHPQINFKKFLKKECIPEGCVPLAAVAVGGGSPHPQPPHPRSP